MELHIPHFGQRPLRSPTKHLPLFQPDNNTSPTAMRLDTHASKIGTPAEINTGTLNSWVNQIVETKSRPTARPGYPSGNCRCTPTQFVGNIYKLATQMATPETQSASSSQNSRAPQKD